MSKHIIHLDFEIRSELDLPKVGAHKWLSDTSTKILCVAYRVDEGEVIVAKGHDFSPSESDMEKWEQLKKLAGDADNIFVAHNSMFECLAYHFHLHIKLLYPKIIFSRWKCSAASAANHNLPRSLKEVAKALGSAEKDEQGKFTMMKMIRPQTPTMFKKTGKKWLETEEAFDELLSYCTDDVIAESEIFDRVGLLPPREQKIFELDFKINTKGIRIDKELCLKALEMKEIIKDKLSKECNEITTWKASQVAKLTTWLIDKGAKIKDLRANTMRDALERDDLSEDVKRVIEIRQDYAMTSLGKYDSALKFEQRGVIRGQFMYCGASATKRWSGKGIQLQNLPRGDFKNPKADTEKAAELIKAGNIEDIKNEFDYLRPMQVLKSCLRGVLIPRKGKKFKVIDFSQIEARIINWFAGQEDVLDVFRSGTDLYKYVASKIFKTAIEKVTKDQRYIGKIATLALGYQGGAGAFIMMSNVYGVDITEKEADKIKNDWRNANSKIVNLWYDIEKAVIKVIKFGKPLIFKGMIKIRIEDDFLTLETPSGNKLHYYKPETKFMLIKNKKMNKEWEKEAILHMGADSKRGIRWGLVGNYGGKIVENVVQNMARDVLADAMLRIDEAGYDIVAHVHDEVIVEVPEDKDTKELEDIFNIVPNWAKGLPIDSESYECTRYYKG